MSGSDLTVALVGWGAIARRVGALLAARRAPVRLVAVATREAAAELDGLPEGCRHISTPEDLTRGAGLLPRLVVEAAGRESVAPWGEAALRAGMDFAVSSTSAFASGPLLDSFLDLARQHGGQILIPPGALGGIDALSAASRLGLARVRHEIIKPPAAWRGTPAETACDLDALASAFVFFAGTARQAAAAYPQNANVAVISALAGLGLDRTEVALVADPAATGNSHRILAEGDFGEMELKLTNRPLATNPKSSEMTALSLVRLIENRAGHLVL
ncbi:aspartate dehydrogenase [Pannonibacter tanglangensis]|uniref:L-aspartate dehydrogenase n=1 Tax=Pannonibacter tanglangensis TaxID=2750084 RepID=A0ABW9ZDK1_9HYPH|nr:aspartate dehydrogenase [Pannonibacter sp. XCT-34]NBN62566.1 aspartate dehydrogenase [Pannonibacter sp. XCT-34]